MTNLYKYEIKSDEYWWGGSAFNGEKFPLSKNDSFVLDMRTIDNENQTMPLFLSNKGRYIWSENPFKIEFKHGSIAIEGIDVNIYEAGETLADAYRCAMKKHFPFDAKRLPDVFFRTAQYNSWMQFMYNPTEDGILEYARDIVKYGFTPGILMIDEGWQIRYGEWDFDKSKFPHAKEMIKELHNLGFKVMLWITPYVDSNYGQKFFYYTQKHPDCKELFMRTETGDIAVVEWWNGYSMVLDFTKESDRRFLGDQLDTLQRDYGVDGFKFDGANPRLYNSAINGNTGGIEIAIIRNNAWNDFGRKYELHEYKDSYKQGGKNMIQRLSDKDHSWEGHGINVLIPDSIIQGLLGTPFICPDMIGGGEWGMFFFDLNGKVDQELFVRMCQCSTLMPMMQFSLAPWQYLDEKHLSICCEMAKLHKQLSQYVITLVRESEVTGEPIVKNMEYEFPGEGFETCVDEFMLGNKYLVAPVLNKGVKSRTVHLPRGKWKYIDGTIFEGGSIDVSAPIEVLPYFERI